MQQLVVSVHMTNGLTTVLVVLPMPPVPVSGPTKTDAATVSLARDASPLQ